MYIFVNISLFAIMSIYNNLKIFKKNEHEHKTEITGADV